MKKCNSIAMAIVVVTQIVASLMFAFNGATYEKSMMPLFFAALMAIMWVLVDINDKLKPS